MFSVSEPIYKLKVFFIFIFILLLSACSKIDMKQFETMYQNSIVGDPKVTKNKIYKLVKENKIDEIAILTWCHNENSRVKSYELFANEFELSSMKELQKSYIN